jgi:hypothetical protein
VPWSEAQETYEFVLSIVMSVITACTVPLLNSQSISYVAVLNTLINVPLFDAVASKLPSWLNFKQAIADSCTFSYFTVLSRVKLIIFTWPAFSSGITKTHMSSLVDKLTNPNGFLHVI